MPSRLFVASSVEGLDVAYAIQQNLEYDATITVWPQGVFELSNFAVEDLLKAASSSDFAIFAFTPDDMVKLRGIESTAVRDNVIFEFGLFVGTISRSRSFIVAPRDEAILRVPTDLIGIKPATYDSNRQDGNLQAALGPACNEIRKKIKTLGPRLDVNMAKYPSLLAFHDSFRQVNWNSLLSNATESLDIVVYYFDSWVNANYEQLVQFFRKPGTRVRIFLSNPNDKEIIENIQRQFPEYNRDLIKAKVAHTKERFELVLTAAGATEDRLEVYYVPHVLNYAVQCIDGKKFVLSVFEMFRQHRIDSPAFVIDLDTNPHMLKFWEKELKGLLLVSTKAT